MQLTPRKLCSFFVDGVPQPRGSKTPVPIVKGGKIVDGKRVGGTYLGLRVKDDNPKSGPWMKDVQRAARRVAFRESLPEVDDPVLLRLTFYRRRSPAHFGVDGKLLPPAPAFPDTTPDLTKLIRGVEDALQSVLLTNDSRVVEQRTRKVWGRREGVLIELFTFPKKMRDVWEATQRSLLP